MAKKKVRRINESQLRGIVHESIKRALNENVAFALSYDEIDEMARINKKEAGNCLFPFDSWEIKIWSNDHEPAHFHIIKEGWDVSFDIENGSLIEIKAQGQKQSVLDYMSQNVGSWLDSKCFAQPKLTNRENARLQWEQLH